VRSVAARDGRPSIQRMLCNVGIASDYDRLGSKILGCGVLSAEFVVVDAGADVASVRLGFLDL